MFVRPVARYCRIALPLVAAGLFFSAGCGSPTPPPKKPAVAKSGDDHDHEAGHGHHHHHHAEKGPHGGALVAIGDDAAHLEVMLEAETGKVTAYVLDGEAEKSLPIKAASLEVSFVLDAHHDHDHDDDDADDKDEDHDDEPVTGSVILTAVEPDESGLAAEFAGVAEALKGADEFEASVKSISIGGKEYKEVKFEYPEGNEHDHHHH